MDQKKVILILLGFLHQPWIERIKFNSIHVIRLSGLFFRVVDLALNPAAKTCFHQYLDPAWYHLWQRTFPKMYRGQICNLVFVSHKFIISWAHFCLNHLTRIFQYGWSCQDFFRKCVRTTWVIVNSRNHIPLINLIRLINSCL